MEIRKQAAAPASTILWIDDEARGDDAIVSLMELEGFDVEVADNGADGLRLAQQRRFDAIVLDLKLADMYGLTVLRRLAREKVNTPVVVVTGCYNEPEVEVDAMEAGAVAFARKPLIVEQLAESLRRCVAGAGVVGTAVARPIVPQDAVHEPRAAEVFDQDTWTNYYRLTTQGPSPVRDSLSVANPPAQSLYGATGRYDLNALVRGYTGTMRTNPFYTTPNVYQGRREIRLQARLTF